MRRGGGSGRGGGEDWGRDPPKADRRGGGHGPPPPLARARGGSGMQDARFGGDGGDDRSDRRSHHHHHRGPPPPPPAPGGGGGRRFGGGGPGCGGGGAGWGAGSGRGPPGLVDRDPSDWRRCGPPPERDEGPLPPPPPPPPPPPQQQQQQQQQPPSSSSSSSYRGPPKGQQGPPGGHLAGHHHHRGHAAPEDRLYGSGGAGMVRRGKDLPLDALETGAVYQALLYAAHELHGFFAHLGVLDEQKGELRCFPASGRVARQGLPPGMIARCERRVAEAHGGGAHANAGPGAMLRGDLLCPVKVRSSSTDKRSGKVRIELALLPTRKLLILDLNGVLFNRYPLGDERRIRQEVSKRPHCDAFLDFCFAHFDVAAWSCCRKETLELGLFGAREPELLFVNHAQHSTSLWPRTSVVSPAKPLFLKQLSRLWAQFAGVDYGASNTILLDNHLEKFEGNPLGTCLIVPEYADGSDPPDAVLSLDGELTAHLAAMAAAPDSAAYARAQAELAAAGAGAGGWGGGGSPFFPAAHPEPPLELGPVLKRALLEAFCASGMMAAEHPELTVAHYMERHETPGPRAIQLRRRSLPEVAGPHQPAHVVCEKSDGTRLFLFLPDAATLASELRGADADAGTADNGSGAFLIDRHWQPEPLAGGRGLREALSPRGGATLLDGELLRPYQEGEEEGVEEGEHIYLVFDVVLLDGEDVGAQPSLQARMDRLRAALGDGSGGLAPLTVAFGGKARAGERVRVVPKAFYPLEDLRAVVETMLRPKQQGQQGEEDGEEDVGEEFVFDDGRRRTLSDGLVFTPAALPYYSYQVHKYKTPRRISVDFKVKLADLGAGVAAVPLYLSVARADVRFTELDGQRQVKTSVSSGQGRAVTTLQLLREHMEEAAVGECIVECDWSRRAGRWVLRTLRTDKRSPNSLQVCWNNLEAIAEGLELPTLVDAVEAVRSHPPAATAPAPPPEAGRGNEEDEGAVAAHYDEMQARRWEKAADALDPRIHNLRRLNNWIKTVVIETARDGVGGVAAAEGDEEDEDDPEVGQRPNPLETLAQREAAAAAAGNGSGRRGGQQQQEALRVLDLACGRGGDVKKWVLKGAEVYVGVDVSPQSVLECRARAEESRRRGGRPRVALVLTRSMLEEDLPDVVARALAAAATGGGQQGNNGNEGPAPVFDVISIQFAVHYGCGSEADLSRLLRTVDRLLAPEGGTLLLTSIDARCLRRHLQERQKQEDGADADAGADAAFGNAVYRVALSPEAAAAAPALDRLGLRYTFSLSSAVEACDEFVVHVPTLRHLAQEEAGLRLARHVNFGRLVHECLPRFGHLLEPLQVGQVSPEEWEAVQLYSALVFQR